MQKAKLTRGEHIVTASLGLPAGLAVSGLLFWGTRHINGERTLGGIALHMAIGIAVSVWIWRNADRLNRPRRSDGGQR